MANFDSFLPSGAVEQSQFALQEAHISPPAKGSAMLLPGHHFHDFRFPSNSAHSSHPISPPTSVDGDSRRSVEAWRQYSANLRDQFNGERAHLISDRERKEELWAEERRIADGELAELMGEMDDMADDMDTLRKRNQELEAENARLILQLEATQQERDIARGTATSLAESIPPFPSSRLSSPEVSATIVPTSSRTSSPQRSAASSPNAKVVNTTTAVPGSIDGTVRKMVPQEDSRNPDGSKCWEPPSNPSRTFDGSEANSLRVEDTPAPVETPLRVNKELTPSDFGVSSPQRDAVRDGSVSSESIDISHIQPSLDGVPIRSTAIEPTFVAKVLSPKGTNATSPTERLSPSMIPPPRPATSISQPSSSSNSRSNTLEVLAQPANTRLTINAGHTPTHSIHKFDLTESGVPTPTQETSLAPPPTEAIATHTLDGTMDEDPALKGPLGLRNKPAFDDSFLAELDKKLEIVAGSRPASPAETEDADGTDSVAGCSVTSPPPRILSPFAADDDQDDKDIIDPVPKLKVKASCNFGKPFGSI